MIIRVRRRLLETVRAFADDASTAPPGVDTPALYRRRGPDVQSEQIFDFALRYERNDT